MAHELPALPFPTNALEPHIDAKTMEIHHGKHHQAYVTNLNKALESAPALAGKSADDLIRDLATAGVVDVVVDVGPDRGLRWKAFVDRLEVAEQLHDQ